MAYLVKKTIDDLQVEGKRVIVRVDFNVPLDKKTGEITDDKRIKGALPTIKKLADEGAKVVLVSHLGRPKNGPEEKFSMRPAVERLSELLGKEVKLAKDVIGEDAKKLTSELQNGEVMMLENVRFHKEETKNDPVFAAELASMADVYVNDAFGTAHRAHASTAGLANYLPSAQGYLIQKEVDIMGKALADPKRPFVAILGGAKVSDKIGVIENLIGKVDTLIIGGGMSYTFQKALGKEVGKSLLELDKVELAKSLMEKAEAAGVEFLLPVDTVISQEFAPDAEHKTIKAGTIPEDWEGMDIGEKTVELYSEKIREAGTVVWNGPMGVFEFDAFAKGTRGVAQAISESNAVSIIGGGDSAAAIEKLGFADKVTHISTGGGASLEFLEGKVLPGISVLSDREERRTMSAGNWKMNLGLSTKASDYVKELVEIANSVKSEVVCAVPFTALNECVKIADATALKIAAQNCHFEDKGAYTGEISPEWLARMEVPYVILGHSERREYFAETDETVNKKIAACLKWGRRPIVCVGEKLEEREAGKTDEVIEKQVRAAFANIPHEKVFLITIAYEPVWAIGTGKTATEEQAQEVCSKIRKLISELYCENCAKNIRILYGGSVNEKNAASLFAQEDIDGGLVGGASLKKDSFKVICEA